MSQGKILAIDDEQNIRHLIRNEFMLEGFDVTTAKSGEEGLGFVDGQDYDVVLLDLKLPKMSGIDTLKLLKRKNPRSEVIMITGYGDIHSAVESVKLGARDYVTKPFQFEEVEARVRTHLRIRDLQQDLEQRHRQLQDSYDELRRLEDLRDNLVHMIVHDMRYGDPHVLACPVA